MAFLVSACFSFSSINTTEARADAPGVYEQIGTALSNTGLYLVRIGALTGNELRLLREKTVGRHFDVRADSASIKV